MRSKLLFFSAVWLVFIALALRHAGEARVESAQSAEIGADRARAPAAAATLYERFGGKAAFAAWAEELEKLIGADPRMLTNARFKSAWSRADRAGLRRGFADYVCERVGGPCGYEGAPLARVFSPSYFGPMEWEYLKEAYVMSLRKTQLTISPEDRAALERVFAEAKDQATKR